MRGTMQWTLIPSENVLLVSRGCFQKMALNLSCSTSWCERNFFTMTRWERSSIFCLCWITVSLKNGLLGNYFPSQQTLCLSCPHLPASIPNVSTQAVCSFCFPLFLSFFFFFSKSPFLQVSAFFSPKIAESRECDRIESQLADWIVFLLYLRLH